MLLDISPAGWANLGFALDVHGRYLRDVHGVALPRDLEQLRAYAWKRARGATGGQAEPTMAAFLDRIHAPRVLAYSYADAATALGVSVRTIKRLVADGKLPAVHIAGAVRIRHDDLLRRMPASSHRDDPP